MKGLRTAFRSASISNRIIAIYTVIFGVSFTIFVLLVFLVPRISLRSAIDAQLEELATQILSVDISRGSDDVIRIPVPPDMNNLYTATTFFWAIGLDGEVGLRSQNANFFETFLDPNGFNNEEYFSTVEFDDVRLRVLTTPLHDNEQNLIGYLQLARIYDQSNNVETSALVVLVGLASVMGAFFMVILVTPNLLKPLVEIADIARQLTKTHDLQIRVPDVNRKDEIGDLTVAFNQLLERLEKVDQEKTDFITVASHELRTPLTPLRSCLEFMLAEKYGSLNEKQKDRLEIALASVYEETRLIENYLDFSRLQEERSVFEPKIENVFNILDSVTKIFEYDARQKQINFIKDFICQKPIKFIIYWTKTISINIGFFIH